MEAARHEQANGTLDGNPEHGLAYVGVDRPEVLVYVLQNVEAEADLPWRPCRQFFLLQINSVVNVLRVVVDILLVIVEVLLVEVDFSLSMAFHAAEENIAWCG